MKKAIFTMLCLLPIAAIAHPGTGAVHDSQHLLWLFAGVVVVAIAAIGFSLKKKSH